MLLKGAPMRHFAVLFLFILSLTAGEPMTVVTIKGGSSTLHATPNIPNGSAQYGVLDINYRDLYIQTSNFPSRRYAELGYATEFGFSGSMYSYFDQATTGIRVQYKYRDKTTGWSPFIGLCAQHSSLQYAGTQPLTNDGFTIGLAYTEHLGHSFRLTCFREFHHAGVANSELAYDYAGVRYFCNIKASMAFGDPERDNNTKRYVGGVGQIGVHINRHCDVYLFVEKLRYMDFLVYDQTNIGFGVRTSF